MDKYINNDFLFLGVIFLIIGLSVGSYSYSTYKEIKNLDAKIDFEMVDNDNSIPTMEKYYKYVSFADFLNQKLTKNKNIPIKNASCVYLDYAQHNAIELYNLADRKIEDESKKFIAAENIRSLYNILENYKTCKKTTTYKSELEEIIKKIENQQNLHSDSDMRLEQFLNSTPVEKTYPTDIQEALPVEQNSQQPSGNVQQDYPQQVENVEQTYPQQSETIPQN